MRLGTGLLALLVSGATLLIVLGAVFLIVPAPAFQFFALGLAAQEWAPWFILGAGAALAGAVLGWRSGRWRTGFLVDTLLLLAALALIGWRLVQTLSDPPRLRASSAALAGVPRGSFSLGAFLSSPPAVDVQRDIAYGPDPLQRFDLYRTGQPTAAPLLVVVHGGSWRSGGKGEVAGASAHWASLGFVVADVAYRLAPEHPFPAAVADVKCAIGTLRRDAARWGIDPQRVVVVGRSAGAQVALVSAYSAGAPELPPGCPGADAPVQGVVGYYAPTLLDYYDRIRPSLTDGALDGYLGGPPEQHAEGYRLARPASWISASTPPTLLLHGERDQFVRPKNATELINALDAAGVPNAMVTLPYANHGFDFSFAGPSNQQVQPWVDAFLRTVAGLDAP